MKLRLMSSMAKLPRSSNYGLVFELSYSMNVSSSIAMTLGASIPSHLYLLLLLDCDCCKCECELVLSYLLEELVVRCRVFLVLSSPWCSELKVLQTAAFSSGFLIIMFCCYYFWIARKLVGILELYERSYALLELFLFKRFK